MCKTVARLSSLDMTTLQSIFTWSIILFIWGHGFITYMRNGPRSWAHQWHLWKISFGLILIFIYESGHHYTHGSCAVKLWSDWVITFLCNSKTYFYNISIFNSQSICEMVLKEIQMVHEIVDRVIKGTDKGHDFYQEKHVSCCCPNFGLSVCISHNAAKWVTSAELYWYINTKCFKTINCSKYFSDQFKFCRS